jgi:hypothetical protein
MLWRRRCRAVALRPMRGQASVARIAGKARGASARVDARDSMRCRQDRRRDGVLAACSSAWCSSSAASACTPGRCSARLGGVQRGRDAAPARRFGAQSHRQCAPAQLVVHAGGVVGRQAGDRRLRLAGRQPHCRTDDHGTHTDTLQLERRRRADPAPGLARGVEPALHQRALDPHQPGLGQRAGRLVRMGRLQQAPPAAPVARARPGTANSSAVVMTTEAASKTWPICLASATRAQCPVVRLPQLPERLMGLDEGQPGHGALGCADPWVAAAASTRQRAASTASGRLCAEYSTHRLPSRLR